MFEEAVSSSIPSIWSSMNNWFTPAVLFVLLNVMIGTIAFTSSLANQKHQQQKIQENSKQSQPPPLDRSPSVLQRLRSINLYSYRSQSPISTNFSLNPDSPTHFDSQQTLQNHTPEKESQHFFQQTRFENDREDEEYKEKNEEEEARSLDEVYSQLNDHHVSRTHSDTQPASGEMPKKLPAKMRKSASLKPAFNHFEEDDGVEARRPATVKEGKTRVAEADDEVDAKADDFINRFKQQLKLQRLNSIIRGKDMIGRGSAK